jgi:hypothetical protein
MESDDPDPDDLGTVYDDFCNVVRNSIRLNENFCVLEDLCDEAGKAKEIVDSGFGGKMSYRSLDNSIFKMEIFYRELDECYKNRIFDESYSSYTSLLKDRLKRIKPKFIEKIKEILAEI